MRNVTPNNFKENNEGALPREHFREAGRATALTSEELLAILLKTGAPGCDVMELSRRLVAAFGGTGHLVKADLATLKAQIESYNKNHPEKRISGIGEAKRMELAAAFEVMSIPTLFVIKNGKVVNQSMGAKPKAQILAMLD